MAAEAVNSVVAAKKKVAALMDLNDNCLLQIFEELSLEELVPVADTCTRFKTLVRRTAMVKHINGNKAFEITIGNSAHALIVNQKQLRIFGDLITNMCVRVRTRKTEFVEYILGAMNAFCFHFDKMKIYSLKDSPLSSAYVKRLSERSIRLAFTKCENVEKYLTDCKTLVGLRLKNCRMDLSSISMPKLQEFELDMDYFEYKYEDYNYVVGLYKFLRRLKNVKTLSILSPHDFDFKHVAQLQQLEDLYINISTPVKNFNSIMNLQNLKAFECRLNMEIPEMRVRDSSKGKLIDNIISNLRSADKLETLALRISDELSSSQINGLLRFKNVRKFSYFHKGPSGAYEYLNVLPNVENLRIVHYLNYKDIINLLSNISTKIKQIQLRYYAKYGTVEERGTVEECLMKMFEICRERNLHLSLELDSDNYELILKKILLKVKNNPETLKLSCYAESDYDSDGEESDSESNDDISESEEEEEEIDINEDTSDLGDISESD